MLKIAFLPSIITFLLPKSKGPKWTRLLSEIYYTFGADRTLWMNAQGEVEMMNGERDCENFKGWIEEIAKK